MAQASLGTWVTQSRAARHHCDRSPGKATPSVEAGQNGRAVPSRQNLGGGEIEGGGDGEAPVAEEPARMTGVVWGRVGDAPGNGAEETGREAECKMVRGVS